MLEKLHFHDQTAMLDRLSVGLKRRSREVVFLVGAPLSAPTTRGGPGVPGVDGMIDLIRKEFKDDPTQLELLKKELEQTRDKRYQTAFQFLQGRRGQQTANEIVRAAVLASRDSKSGSLSEEGSGRSLSDEECRFLEMDGRGWALSPATENLGRLVADFPQVFGKAILTTNFDPLIEVAIRRAGGSYFKTALHADGNLLQTEGNGCHVVHLHGYWYGADTLHTGRQLGQFRPRLKASLAAVLRSKLVVVCAYSGWDDSFTDALMEVVRDDSAFPEIIWAFHAAEPVVNDSLTQRLLPGMDRGRVNLYSGVDCHSFFPELFKAWQGNQAGHTPRQNPDSNPVRVRSELVSAVENRARTGVATVIEGDDEDRPPSVEICVGRDDELAQIQASTAKIVFLTGVGGQGKSTLAARYFEDCQKKQSFSVYVWRDCKEESERFEIQLASVIERLSNGKMSGEDLAKQSAASLVDILLGFIRNLRVLFVFDNADHYVNLEELRMTAGTALLLDALLHSDVNCRVIFTCRPEIIHEHPLVLSLRLSGISLPAAVRLFEKRGAPSASDEIADAHELTEGHAF